MKGYAILGDEIWEMSVPDEYNEQLYRNVLGAIRLYETKKEARKALKNRIKAKIRGLKYELRNIK